MHVLGWAVGFCVRTAIYSTCRLFVFLLIDKVEFVSFDNSAGSIFSPHYSSLKISSPLLFVERVCFVFH